MNSLLQSKIFQFVALVAIVSAIPITVMLSQQQQEIRQRAEARPSFTVHGIVFVDSNNNGVMDATERGMRDVKVVIENPKNGIYLTTATDLNGEYAFNNLPGGEYKGGVILPDNYIGTTQLELNNLLNKTTVPASALEVNFGISPAIK